MASSRGKDKTPGTFYAGLQRQYGPQLLLFETVLEVLRKCPGPNGMPWHGVNRGSTVVRFILPDFGIEIERGYSPSLFEIYFEVSECVERCFENRGGRCRKYRLYFEPQNAGRVKLIIITAGG